MIKNRKHLRTKLCQSGIKFIYFRENGTWEIFKEPTTSDEYVFNIVVGEYSPSEQQSKITPLLDDIEKRLCSLKLGDPVTEEYFQLCSKYNVTPKMIEEAVPGILYENIRKWGKKYKVSPFALAWLKLYVKTLKKSY